MKPVFSYIYQWLVFVPILVASTVFTALLVMLGCTIWGNKLWGYIPPKYWSKIVCRTALCKIKVTKKTHLDPNQSYVFIANHQSAFDIFLTYGYLEQNIKWVQKYELRSLPFVGRASQIAGHVFVDNSSVRAMTETIEKAEKELHNGVSIVIFPEGARAKNGKMSRFKKGAYLIATQMQLPIVPLTLNGPYDVLKRGSRVLDFGKQMELIVHEPILTKGLGEKNISELMEKTYNIIASGLWEKYK